MTLPNFFKERRILDEHGSTVTINSCVKIDDDNDEKHIEFLSQNEVEDFAQDYQKLTTSIYTRILKRDKEGIILAKESILKEKVTKVRDLIIDKKFIVSIQFAIEQLQKEHETYKKIVDSFSSTEYTAINDDIKSATTKLTELNISGEKFNGLILELNSIVSREANTIPGAIESSNLYNTEKDKIVKELSLIISNAEAVDFSTISIEKQTLTDTLTAKKEELTQYLSGRGLTEENLMDITNAHILMSHFESEITTKNDEKIALQKKIDAFDPTDITTASREYKEELEKQIQSVSAILEKVDNSSVKPISLQFAFDDASLRKGILEDFKKIFESEINKSEHNYKADKLEEILFCIPPDALSDKTTMVNAIAAFYSQSTAKDFLIDLFSDEVNFEIYKLSCLKNILNYSDFKKIKVQYDGRPIEKSSFGQRCTAVLVIMLLLGNNPIIIDEPEAHLDSLLISNYLVEVIKEKKGNRQVIFATHSANFVINGDAELIHLLDIDPVTGLTKLVSTTIENPVTRLSLIGLEGGKEAFLRRENKYQVER